MKKNQSEIIEITEKMIDLICLVQEEEVRNVLERVHEIRLKQNDLSCDEDSEDEENYGNIGSGSESDDNSFFETDSDDD